jgi:two-component system response regulator PilR (NtrC family)
VLCTSGNGRLRAGVPERLRRLGATVLVVPTLGEAMKSLDGQPADLCVVDLTANGGLPASVRLLRTRHPRVALVGLVDPSDSLMAGEAVQAGIADVLPWPCEDRDLALALANVADRMPWGGGQAVGGEDGHDPLFAHSSAMREVLDLAESVAASRGGVIVCGEPGTGRSLIARTIHRWSPGTTAESFVEFDCGADDPQVVERRLFGTLLDRNSSAAAIPTVHVGRTGAVLAARGGTLYLTRVAELPARVQSALARLLRDREAVLDGRQALVDLDVRPIAALEPDVEAVVSDGRLQVDLFERLSQWRVDLAPLRRRREDVPALAAWLLGRACRTADVAPKAFSRSALALLSALPWHGNVEDLRGLVDRVVRAVTRPVVQIDDLLDHASLDGFSARIEAGVTLKDAKTRFERDCITAVLRRHHGRVGEAAKALGIQRTNLYRKVRQLKVSRSLLSARK